MRKKILFILHYPPPVHGSAMVGLQIKQSKVINETFDCDFINLSTSTDISRVGVFNFTKLKVIFAILGKTISKLRKTDYDLVYFAPVVSGFGFIKDFLIVILIKFHRKKITYHLHNKGVSKYGKNKIFDLAYKYFFKGTKLILLSDLLFDDIKGYVEKKDISICPNGIADIENLQEEMDNNKINSIPSLLFISNLIKSKGVEDLLIACSILQGRGVKFKCSFIGGEADIDRKTFESIKHTYGLGSNVNFHGKVFGEEKNQYLLSSDIFILPTYYHFECLPLVIIEAMQFGLPIVSTREGGIPDLVKDGLNGVMVKRNNPRDLADKLEYLIKRENLIKMFGKESRRRYMMHFTGEEFEKRMNRLLLKFTE